MAVLLEVSHFTFYLGTEDEEDSERENELEEASSNMQVAIAGHTSTTTNATEDVSSEEEGEELEVLDPNHVSYMETVLCRGR